MERTGGRFSSKLSKLFKKKNKPSFEAWLFDTSITESLGSEGGNAVDSPRVQGGRDQKERHRLRLRGRVLPPRAGLLESQELCRTVRRVPVPMQVLWRRLHVLPDGVRPPPCVGNAHFTSAHLEDCEVVYLPALAQFVRHN